MLSSVQPASCYRRRWRSVFSSRGLTSAASSPRLRASVETVHRGPALSYLNRPTIELSFDLPLAVGLLSRGRFGRFAAMLPRQRRVRRACSPSSRPPRRCRASRRGRFPQQGSHASAPPSPKSPGSSIPISRCRGRATNADAAFMRGEDAISAVDGLGDLVRPDAGDAAAIAATTPDAARLDHPGYGVAVASLLRHRHLARRADPGAEPAGIARIPRPVLQSWPDGEPSGPRRARTRRPPRRSRNLRRATSPIYSPCAASLRCRGERRYPWT